MANKEQIAAAIKRTEYKYFGSYEFTDEQQEAVDVLVDVAKTVLEQQPSDSLLPVKSPEQGKPVHAVIKHFKLWDLESVELVLTEDSWQFKDKSKLAYEWNVIYWEYI